jgi:hypothetical protein
LGGKEKEVHCRATLPPFGERFRAGEDTCRGKGLFVIAVAVRKLRVRDREVAGIIVD